MAEHIFAPAQAPPLPKKSRVKGGQGRVMGLADNEEQQTVISPILPSTVNECWVVDVYLNGVSDFSGIL